MRDLPEDGIYGLASQPVDVPVRNDGTYRDGLRLNEPVPEPMLTKPNSLTSQQLLSEYEIRIRFLAKGCVVNVGCKELAFSSVEEAMSHVQNYVQDPKGVGDYWKKEFNMI